MTSTTPKPSQPRRRNRRGEGQRLREELLAAADAIVTETGDGSALSLRSVAARAGVAATSVYLQFADIDALKAARRSEASPSSPPLAIRPPPALPILRQR